MGTIAPAIPLVSGQAWQANHPAVEATMRPGMNGSPDFVEVLSHCAYPYADWVASGIGLTQRLREFASEYLDRVAQTSSSLSEIRKNWRAPPEFWDWLDLTWGSGDLDVQAADPRLSFWAETERANAPAADRTAVLLAGPQSRRSSGSQISLGGGRGLRVFLQVGPDEGHGHLVRITGSAFSAPQPMPSQGLALFPESLASLWANLAAIKEAISSAVGLTGMPTALRDVALGETGIAATVVAAQGEGEARRILAYSLELALRDGEDQLSATRRETVHLVTHATPIGAIVRDPASSGQAVDMVKRRASRSEAQLEPYVVRPVPTLLLATAAAGAAPVVDLATDEVIVRGNHLAQNSLDPGAIPQRVPAGALPLRGDDQSAIHAFVRGTEWMAQLHSMGLPPERCFKMARLPVVLRHRAAMKRGRPDGDSVNAQVQPTSEGLSLHDAFVPDRRTQIEVRFGAANLRHRAVQRSYTGRRRPQHLGLAADRRWAWHEFGHVLAFAATGTLEFGFTHSAGDALAAVLCDPDSQLSVDPGADPDLRFKTFPWVPIDRHHNRSALRGWCWCGRRNLRRYTDGLPHDPVFTGYFAEQLLSTTIFRLYRALGGDTFSSVELRRKAANFTAFLVVRAICSLGPSTVVPARSANHLCAAMESADSAIAKWSFEGRTDAESVRVGGMAHKLVRWAFERQGLFAADGPRDLVEGAGRPPRVDIQLFDGRLDGEGGYGPSALDWQVDPSGPIPDWHANEAGFWVGGRSVNAKVLNRGRETAHDVVANVWVSPAGAVLQWHELPRTRSTPVDIGAVAVTTFHFDAVDAKGIPLTGDHLALVSVSCPGDRSNLDLATGLACSGSQPPLSTREIMELVSGDNNIGLRIFTF